MAKKPSSMQAPIGIPLVGSLVAFILVTLALFSGKQPGFMEDYNIISFNTSELGKNLVPTAASSDQPSTATGCISGINLGPLDKGCSAVASAAGSLETAALDKLHDIENDIADKLADSLGIREFYSLHVLDICEGTFSPNVTAVGATANVTSCTTPFKTAEYNVTALFDHELQVGPLHINLEDIGFTQDLQHAFDALPDLLKALGVIFILAMGFTGLSLLCSTSSLFLLPEHSRVLFITNSVLAGLAFLSLFIGSTATTIAARKAAGEINDHGANIGLSATPGNKFIAITWSATILMAISTGYWALAWFKHRRGGAIFRMGYGGSDMALRKSESSSSPQMGYAQRMHIPGMRGGRQS
ncbi:hypothetical protein GQ53DRAFT_376505 [Thozetella sp. PMI_491]|nr:hypothetical protein GQ53DRAFT_376505 [Thozetella sp. PMI_491]